jgi:Ni,Fe-hydrogenase I large subunit
MSSQPFVGHVIGRAGCSAVARLLARVVELVSLMRPDRRPRTSSCGAAAPGPGRGLGWVETARGLLVHSVELATGRVKHYRIVAPTEWNFHPRGALPAGLAGTAAADAGEVKRLVELVVQSLDPCVEARVEVAHV